MQSLRDLSGWILSAACADYAMSTLSNSIAKSALQGFLRGALTQYVPPKLEWVRIIRCTEKEEILLSGMYNDELYWEEFESPVKWEIQEIYFCVVADYGEGPHGYFWSTDEAKAEHVATAMREGRLQDVVTLS